MNHQAWSIVLFACAAQCIFLIIALLLKPLVNKRSATLLLTLLLIILATTVSNTWSSTYLYRSIPQVAGFARGMVLLLGPVLYLYIVSVLKPGFLFRPVQLLHFTPYLAALVIIKWENIPLSDTTIIQSIDLLMKGEVPMSGLSVTWFIAYSIHLFIYIFAARGQIIRSIRQPALEYMIPLQHRITWLKRITIIFVLIALLFMGHTVHIILTGKAGILTNYIYNLVLAVIVYMIGFQAIADNRLLSPGFATKYNSAKVNEQLKKEIKDRLLYLFEKEKIFTDPGLTLSVLAQKLNTNSNAISQVVNNEFNRTFNDLVNYYRVEEFKKRVPQPEYAAYSIMGVAYDVGYNSKSSFNTAFKKQTGMTPSEYLRSISR